MLRGLYISATSLVTKTESLNVTSNNLANNTTTGYKRDFVTYEAFRDVMISKIGGQYGNGEVAGQPITLTKSGDAYTAHTDNGYFEVNTHTGVSLNRAVKFMKNEEGYLSTFYLNSRKEVQEGIGYRVQGQNGDIYIGDNDYEIDDIGQVIVNGEVVDQLVHNYPPNAMGTLNNGIRIDRIMTNYDQGELTGTGNDLDFALVGEGFFKIETPAGVRYTRNGSFKINNEYELTTNEGYNVIGFDGKIVLGEGIVQVNSFGEITVNGEIVDKFSIVNPNNIEDMLKEGGSLYRMDDEFDDIGFSGEIKQGFLEKSNVTAITEMIQMMELYRNYESSQKLVTTYDATLDKVINEVGVV